MKVSWQGGVEGASARWVGELSAGHPTHTRIISRNECQPVFPEAKLALIFVFQMWNDSYFSDSA